MCETSPLSSYATSSTWQSGLICGTLGGVAGTLAGQPFDVLKVRAQVPSSDGMWSKRGILAGCQTLFRGEGIRGLFRGLGPPLSGQGLLNAMLFATERWCMRLIEDFGPAFHVQPHSVFANFLTGSMAGFVSCFAISPIELIKIQLQLDSSPWNQGRHGAVNCLRHIWRTSGIRGLFCGLSGTFARDIHSFGIYFGSFEYTESLLLQTCRKLGWYQNLSGDDTRAQISSRWIQAICSFLAGGTAGIAAWIASYPADVVKSRMQAISDFRAKQPGFFQLWMQIVKEEGHQALWVGLRHALVRAFIVNAATFGVYHEAYRLLFDSCDD